MKTLDISLLLTEYQHAQEALASATEAFDNAEPGNADKKFDELEKYQTKVFQVACQIVDILLEDV
jgi:hypothetical protein